MASFVQNKYRTQDEDGWRVCKRERELASSIEGTDTLGSSEDAPAAG